MISNLLKKKSYIFKNSWFLCKNTWRMQLFYSCWDLTAGKGCTVLYIILEAPFGNRGTLQFKLVVMKAYQTPGLQ